MGVHRLKNKHLLIRDQVMQLIVKDVIKLLNVPEDTLYHWINTKGLPAYRIKDQLHFNSTEVLEWATSYQLPISANALAGSDRQAASLPRLPQILEAGGIFYSVPGITKEQALRNVVELLPVPSATNREFLLGMLLAREALGTTSLGNGIAIPHPRNPIILDVIHPTITLCFLEHPIDYADLDGIKVSILFIMISPTVRIHLYLLSHLAFILRDMRFLAAIKHHAPRETIIAEADRVISASFLARSS
jgi:PTS system nitrogen regulatory IIA component